MESGGFRNLDVWKRSKELAVDIYKTTSSGKLEKDFGLRDQIRRSAISVPCNIAEGDERSSNKDSVRFLYIAKGSLAELMTQLEIAHDIGYLSEEDFSSYLKECDEIGKMIGGLIKHRQKTYNL